MRVFPPIISEYKQSEYNDDMSEYTRTKKMNINLFIIHVFQREKTASQSFVKKCPESPSSTANCMSSDGFQ